MKQWVLVCDSDTPPPVGSSATVGNVIKCNAGPGNVGGVPSVIEYQPTYKLLVPPPAAPFDLVEGSGFFFFGFGVVIFGYLLGFAVGQVRKPIRQGS